MVGVVERFSKILNGCETISMVLGGLLHKRKIEN